MNHTVHFAVLAALLFACTAVFAADSDKNKAEKHDITLKSGKVLKDAVILDKKPNGVTFGYKDGASFVRFSDMPEKAQKYFNYNPEEAEKYEKKIESQKAANKKAAEKQKAKEQKQKAEQDKRNHERRIAQQEQTVRKLELQLEEAKKKLSNTENTVSQDRGALVSTLNDNTRVRVDTPWGVGSIRTSNNNGAVRNKLMKEVDTLSVKRDNQAQDVIDLQLKLEAAQKTLEKLKEGSN
ncbi:MAG: hypothetical protein IKP09_09875 [Lentisphaeria bacterium]|nr:hypothetical protein [Lentisphaeria bacterium]